MKRLLLIFSLLLPLLSCEKEPSLGERYASSVKPSTTLYIYGGASGNVYLGKLNASKFDSESIWNEYGKYGSKYRTDCIWNQFGQYGSDYGTYSPFNKFGTKPPALYDRYNNFHGYFSANKSLAGRATYELIDIICENHEKIRDDVSGWYDRIFNY